MKRNNPFIVPTITSGVIFVIACFFFAALAAPVTFLVHYLLVANVVIVAASSCLLKRRSNNLGPQKPDDGMECNSVADFVRDTPIKLSMFCLNCIACLYLIAIAVATLGTILGRRPLAILGLVMVAVVWYLERYLNRRASRKINDEERRWRIK